MSAHLASCEPAKVSAKSTPRRPSDAREVTWQGPGSHNTGSSTVINSSKAVLSRLGMQSAHCLALQAMCERSLDFEQHLCFTVQQGSPLASRRLG